MNPSGVTDLNKNDNSPVPSLPIELNKFGRYEVLKLIGEGAMGKVFLASDPVLKRQVAIKIISVDKQLDEKVRVEFLKRFSIEARLSAQLSHPSIVPVYDAGEQNGVPWIAFQYIDGVTLDKLIVTHGKLSVKWAVSIAANIASALQLAHKINVIHRDIKPSNIIIDRHGGIAKLTDFGVAKTPLASLTMEGNAMGSPGYMSPEQIEGRDLDHRSDLFSLGVVLYEMVTGKHPFIRDSITTTAYATISGKYTPIKLIVKDVPTKLEAIIAQCLEPATEKRITDAARLMELLGNIATRAHSDEDGKRRLTSILIGLQGFIKKSCAGVSSIFNAGFTASKRQFHAFFNSVLLQKIIPAKIPRTVILVLAVILSVSLLYEVATRNETTTLWILEKGLDNNEKTLLAEFRTFFSDGDLDSAASRASLLTLGENSAATGQFLQGLVACRQKEFDEAKTAFEAAAALPNGKAFLEHNRHYMVVRYALVNERMPDMLVAVMAGVFGAAEDHAVLKAIRLKPYWPRWNALRILQASGKKVDLTKVFILDLKYADDRRVRLQAIRDLGELGDRRAVSALKDAAKMGKTDPSSAAAASRVLKKIFKEK